MPTLFLICGLPGSGKTTLAKQLEAEKSALRLCPDEWMEHFSFNGNDETKRAQVESLQWKVASQALELGMNVVLENGFWSRKERDDYRARAKKLSAQVELHFLDVNRDELWTRLKQRNASLPPATFHVEEHDLDLWMKQFEAPTLDELNNV